MEADTILRTDGLTKDFRGFRAVDGVGLTVRRGTVHALIGPNGAGKTTCFNLLTKFLPPSDGSITYKGRDITGMKPADVARLGLVRSFQISAVFGQMSVMENIRIALQRRRGHSYDFWRPQRLLEALDGEALALAESVGLAGFAATPAAQLSYGRKRALELATTLALDPEMLLLDEPMAGMNQEEKQEMAGFVAEVNASFGTTIVLIEHDVGIVMGLAGHVVVLDYGRKVADGAPEAVRSNPDVIAAYLGTVH